MKMIKSKISEKELIEFKKRRYARIAVQTALKKGDLMKSDNCELCKENTLIEAHHVDYGQPLKVMWLCKKCHGLAHRKASKWNPENNSQSPMPFLAEKNQIVTVTFTMPLKNFLTLQKQSDKTKKAISKLVRDEIIKIYPVVENQLDLFEEVNFDKAQVLPKERIQHMAQDEKFVLQSENSFLSQVWSQGNSSRRKLEGKFFSIPGRNGRNSAKLQRNKTY